MNPINPNKFISFKDQQSMGQLNDPLQTEQNFLANRMSQPVPVPEVQSPMMQTDYPHAGTKYNHVGVQNLQEKGFIFDDKKGPYVVNEELTGTSRDTLRLPKHVWRSPKNEPYNSGNLIDDVEYVELANKANKK